LLGAGADPNDGESLYHSLENPACTRLLLQAGARVVGSNALYRVLDLDDVGTLRLLLASGGDPNEPAGGRPTADWGTPLLWAIRRRRSPAHIEALLAAGADPSARTPDGTGAHALALRFGLTDVAKLLAARLSGTVSRALLPDDERRCRQSRAAPASWRRARAGTESSPRRRGRRHGSAPTPPNRRRGPQSANRA
jgi:ankyrin repeat protein